MNRGLLPFVLATSFAVSTPAWALFNAQVLTGKRTAKWSASNSSSDTTTGTELRAAAHLDPIPLVPVAFGIAASQTTFDDESTKFGVSKIDGTDIDLEVEAWLPLELAGLVPYAKLSYTIAGKYEMQTITGTSITPKAIYNASGTALHVGIKYEFLLRLGIMAEYEMGNRKLSFDKVTDIGGLDISGLPDVDQNSTSFLIGVQAGL